MLAALVAVLLITGSVLVGVASNRDRDSETVAGDTTDTVEVPEDSPDDESSEPRQAGPATQAEVDSLVEDISAWVEEERGLDFLEPVKVELEDDDAFESRLLDGSEEEFAQMEAYDVLYQALGLIDPDDSLADLTTESMATGVVGFYDPVSKELVIRGTTLSPFTEKVIAHELTHALDDQHFDLDRPEIDAAQDEAGFGFSALVEGNASYIEERYFREQLTDDEQSQSVEEEMSVAIGGDYPDISSVLLELFSAPYIYGPDLIDALLEEGGSDALNEAFADPPTTSEQVLRPGAYIARQAAVEVTHPTPDGDQAMEGVIGQLFIQLILDDELSHDSAGEAADGWGGDWVTAWRDGEQSCARLTMVGDSADDSDELLMAWSRWAQEVDVDATLEQAGAGGAVTLKSCA